MSYKTGTDRSQINLFPISVDESISEDNVVRVIDAFVEWLDLSDLGFKHTKLKVKGASVYPPQALLKLYLYGYLNRIRSSRRLEIECVRNIELLWLLKRLTPQYHTIADFRKDNADALKGVFKEFMRFCVAVSLVEGESIVFDGTKIRAQNNQKNNFNAGRLEKLLTRIDAKTQQYEQYLKELDEQDAQETSSSTPVLAGGKTKEQVNATLNLLKERRTKYQAFQKQLQKAAEDGGKTEDLQISTVDPDARCLPFKQGHVDIGYNVQTAADAKHGIIVHFEVTNVGDNNALSSLTLQTKEALGLKEHETFNALADGGYHTASELSKCAEQGIFTYVCTPDAVKEKEKTDKNTPTFGKNDFVYNENSDAYTCPNQQELTSNGTWYEHKVTKTRKKATKYKQYTLPSLTCQACPFAAQCQGNRKKQWHGKTIERLEYDDAVHANRKRMSEKPETYKKRKEVIEHPFGTIKRSWGCYYALVKTKKKVGGEFAIIYLCYNLRRVISILGVKGFMEALTSGISVLSGFFKHFRNTFFQTTQILLQIAQSRTKFKTVFKPE